MLVSEQPFPLFVVPLTTRKRKRNNDQSVITITVISLTCSSRRSCLLISFIDFLGAFWLGLPVPVVDSEESINAQSGKKNAVWWWRWNI
jgi:hypothetical protein